VPTCSAQGSSWSQGAKAYGRGYGDADSPPQANKTRNKTKQRRADTRQARPSAARPPDSHPHPRVRARGAPSRQLVSQTTNPVPSTSVPTPSTLGHVDARTTTLLPGTSWSLDCDCYSSAAAAVPTRPLTYRRARAGSQNSFASPPASASAVATRRALGTARFRVMSWTARLAPCKGCVWCDDSPQLATDRSTRQNTTSISTIDHI